MRAEWEDVDLKDSVGRNTLKKKGKEPNSACTVWTLQRGQLAGVSTLLSGSGWDTGGLWMEMNSNQDVGVKRGRFGDLGFDGGCSVMRSLLVIIGHSSTSSRKVTDDRCRLVLKVEEYYLPGVCLAFGLKTETISWLPLGSSWEIQTWQLPGCNPQTTPESPKSVSP